MPEILRYIASKLLNPGDTFRALRLRADMRWLMLCNRFRWSAVAGGNSGPVVSLTTYGKRVQAVYLAIESIARGSALPSRLILWIDDPALYANLPPTLLRLKRRGLEIRYCKNFGPHKKYYPYVESQRAFNAPLVTAALSSALSPVCSPHGRLPCAFGALNGSYNCVPVRLLMSIP